MSSNNKEFTEAELCDLLDSAVDDFCRKEESLTSPTNNNDGSKVDSKSSTSKGAPKSSPGGSPASSSSALPPGADPFSLFDSDPQLRENLSKIIKSCNDESGDLNDLDFQESLHQALKLIAEKAENASDPAGGAQPPIDDEELLRTLKNLDEFRFLDEEHGTGNGQSGIGGGLNNIMPLMSDIMENLLSKDFLYPTLSDLQKKYPEYLAANKSKLAKAEYERFAAQYGVVQKICEEFELESDSDTAEVKHARFQQILAHMQAMQGYGSPPADLMPQQNGSGSDPASPFPGGLPNLSQFDQSACCLM